MLLPQGVEILPQTLDQLAPFEMRLLIFVFVVLLVWHAHSLICRILGIPENLIKRLFKMVVTWF